MTRKLGAFKTSMLQDVEAGKPLEIDALLTVVREIADRVDVPTPNLDALLGLTRVFAQTRGLYPAACRDLLLRAAYRRRLRTPLEHRDTLVLPELARPGGVARAAAGPRDMHELGRARVLDHRGGRIGVVELRHPPAPAGRDTGSGRCRRAP